MKAAKRKRLEGAGWQVGSTDDFLKLSKEEAAFVEMKLALADSVRRRRQARRLTQTQLANKVGSSQSRIAKMEVADASVSIDLLMKTLLSMGASRTELARVISRSGLPHTSMARMTPGSETEPASWGEAGSVTSMTCNPSP